MRLQKWLPYGVVALVYITLAVAFKVAITPMLNRPQLRLSREQRHVYALEEVLRQDNAMYRDQLIRDSILPLIPRKPGPFVLMSGIDNHQAEYFRRALLRRVPANANAAVGIAAIDVLFGNHPALENAFVRSSTFTGKVDGVPYCFTVLPAFHKDVDEYSAINAAGPRMMDECRLWATYGAPGNAVADWLEHGGSRFAREAVVLAPEEYRFDHQSPFGRRDNRWFASLQGQMCIAGSARTCEMSVLGPDSIPSAARLAQSTLSYWQPRIFPGETAMLTSLESAFGRERFAAFWHSNAPVPRAFRDAFGISLGTWVQQWSAAALGPLQVGAGLTATSILLSLLSIAVFIGAALAVAMRRSV